MKLKLALASLFLLLSTSVFAQDEIAHHDVSFSVGAAVPTGQASRYLNNAPMIAFDYGYRFNRFFGAGGGFQIAFNAADNQNPEVSDAGQVQGGDHEFMIPFTGRFFVPLPLQKWQLAIGGGPAYLHYAETAPSYYSGCFTCTSRGGWGFQGVANVKYLFGDNLYVGGTLQYVAGTVSGDAVGNAPAISTKDKWWNALMGVGFRF
jgi:Outer membrane protein beta-barrel domain